MKTRISFKSLLLSIILLLASCEANYKKNKVIKTGVVPTNIIETKIIYTTCGKGDIAKYIKDGWKVVKEEKDKVPCSWTKKQSSPNCKPQKDKGCLLTVPKTMGEEIKYFIEKSK